jgi:hypothetical protein
LLVPATEVLAVWTILTVRPISATTVASASAMAKTILPAVTLIVAILPGILLRLPAAGDECRKTADILSAFVTALVRLRVGLLLLLMLLMLLLVLRLMLLMLLLLVLRAILDLLITRRKRLRVTRQIRLLLRLSARSVAWLVLTHERLIVVFVPIEGVIAGLWLPAGRAALLMRLLLIVVGVLLTKLFLRGGDQAEVVFCVLIVILSGYRVAGSLRVTRELDVLFRNMRGGAADFDVGTVRLVNAREGILTFAVVASPPHALLTVSHVVPVRRPFTLSRHSRRTQLNLQAQTNLIARPDLRYVRANDRNVVSCIALVAATPLPRSQPQRCQPLVTRIVLGFEK